MRTVPVLASCLTLAALVLTGCDTQAAAQRRSYDWNAAGNETYSAHHPHLVMGSPASEAQQAGVNEAEAAGEPVTPYWLSRNDQRLNVRVGYRSAEISDYSIYTYDRQYQFGDRVYDYYSRHSSSVRYGRMVR